ncbi:MAG: Holliday junction branch migration protein RuvA [Vicinamibacterales bacterium]|jgi:Holliday junction DNA helicase RuvA|nr:Holliday junction branch migration protein RuvA [Vicinamibacterales bacterium]
MIALLRGRLVEKHPNRLIVDVGGVGYDVAVPLSTFYDLAEPGSDVSLRVHTHVREDLIALYGFGSALEQSLFERLISVNGVGPKLAMAVLSGIEPADLVKAVRTADVARLSSIPGIGRKTAERVVLELKDKLPVAPADAGAGPAAVAGDTDAELRTDVLSALVNLGYQRAHAEKAIGAVLKDPQGPRVFDRVLRQALRGLSK